MEFGKVKETVLKRSILKKIGHRREEVILGPGIGMDCAAVQLGEDETAVLSTDPITAAGKHIGILAVHTTVNDLAASGAEPVGILVSILLPERARESKLKEIMDDMERTCRQLQVEIIGGHTEVSRAVTQPILTTTGIGKCRKEEMTHSKKLTPGQDLVMTKWAGLEATAILSVEKEEQLRTRYSMEFLEGAQEMFKHLSVLEEAKIAKKFGAAAMHDITEGGIFGALWEMAAASNVGVEVELKQIPMRQETIEISEFFDLNPYQMLSGGSLLIGCNDGKGLAAELKKAGIPANVIGKVTNSNDKVVCQEEERRFIEPVRQDEVFKVL